MNDLKDKIVVVTGGNGLLGASFMERIRRAGAVAVSADIQAANDPENGLMHCDITDEASVTALIAAVVAKHGKIDGWINNAYPRTKDWGTAFENIPLASWQKNVDMHLNGYFLCCQLALEQMKEQGSGSLINMGSIYGIAGPDFTVYEGTEIVNPAAYSAIKGGIINLTRYLASYYGRHNVRVNCISPGGIFDNQHETFVKQYEKRVPMKRMGSPSDIAPAAVFLLSDDSSYITGHNLVIDGGWSAV
jgi:NAD(P)-dependent dehydrogenase (short-subunit alcohol dehydrogenase family)